MKNNNHISRVQVLKSALIFFIPLFIMISGIVFCLFYYQSGNEKGMILEQQKNIVARHRSFISEQLASVISDLFILSGNAHFKMYLETDSSDDGFKAGRDFIVFSRNKKRYDQISFIDINGHEKVRVNYNNGQPETVHPSALQDKKQRYYFTSTIQLPAGSIYLSPFDLNIEKGKVEEPYKPMVRLGMPVFNNNGDKKGVLVLNLLGNTILQKFDDFIRSGGVSADLMVLNTAGYWLKGGSNSGRWGFMFPDKKGETFQKYHPSAWEIISAENVGQFSNEKGVYTFETFYLPSKIHTDSETVIGKRLASSVIHQKNGIYRWKIVSCITASAMNRLIKERLTLYLVFVLPLFLILAMVSGLLSNANLRRKYAESELKKNNETLEIRVEQRTNELAVMNRELADNVRELKLTRQILHSSDKYYRSLINSLHEDILVIGQDYRISDVNETFLNNSGFNRADVYGAFCYEITHGYDRPCHYLNEPCQLQEAFTTAKPQTFTNNRYCHENRRFRADVCLAPLIDEKGETTYVVHACRDMSALNDAEQALFESEEKYRFLVNNAKDAIFIIQNDRIQFANPETALLTGYDPEEIKELALGDLIHEKDLADTESGLSEQWDSGTYRFRIHTRNEGIRWVELTRIIVDWQKKPAMLNFMRDISEKKKLEEKLRQAQKMEAIGTLAGGIAHDFNNILFPVMGYTELALDASRENEKLTKQLREIMNGVGRAKDLVSQILTFSRQTEQDTRPLQVSLVVNEALRLIKSTFPSTIKIVMEIDKKAGRVLADPTQIHQVVMNLCTNALHAMQKEGGTLTISLNSFSTDGEEAGNTELKEGSYVLLRISDTGHGIDRENIVKIYDPYFTTKKKEEGTGLGLSVVHGIIQSCGGTISVYSDTGKGTAFNIYLPVVEADPDGIRNGRPAEQPVVGGSEHIMLVDDEDKIVRMEKEMLEKLGYKISSYTSSTRALADFQAAPDSFDMVITDLTMPEIVGDRLAIKVKEIRPETPVILMTGFGGDITWENARELGINGFIHKPAPKKLFARTIRKLFDGESF